MTSSSPTTTAIKLAACVAIGAMGWLVPAPEGVSLVGWHALGVFVATIASFLIRPLPMGPMVLLALVALAVSGTLQFKGLMAGFGDTTVWLVVAAFLIAGAVQRTGFGRRIALTLVNFLGKSVLGIGYSVCAAELVLGPCVPSNTARGGGILAPIVRSLAEALGSDPRGTPERAGRYLILTAAHANLITAAMFLTGMAANPLVAETAATTLGVEFGWGTWALGALVPGLAALALLPLVTYRLAPPSLTNVSPARAQARSELDAMGPWTRGEKVMAAVFVLLVVLWSTKSIHGMGAGLVAWIGVLALVVSGTERWSDVTSNAKAWDTLIWLGGLLAMANALKVEGVVSWFASTMQSHLSGFDGVTLVVVLALIYFYSMYGFSMLTAHISAMVGAFLALAAGAGAPPMVAVAVLAYFSSLCGCTTHYSTGPVVIYFGFGYVSIPTWFRVGAIISLFHMAIWLGLGLAWWKLLGWW